MKKTIFALLGMLALSACVTPGSSRFTLDDVARQRDDIKTINTPNDWVYLIWTGGSPGQYIRQSCPQNKYKIPPIISDLDGKKVSDKKIALFIHCPKVIGEFAYNASMQTLSENRKFGKAEMVALELDKVIRQLKSQGVQANHIFLSGQSSGGFASLIAAKAHSGNIGGAIALAPADHGKGRPLQQDINPNTAKGWTLLKYLNFNDILDSKHIDSLIFAFKSDRYSNVEDLELFGTVSGTTVFKIGNAEIYKDNCISAEAVHHWQAYSACFKQHYAPKIIDFIEKRMNSL